MAGPFTGQPWISQPSRATRPRLRPAPAREAHDRHVPHLRVRAVPVHDDGRLRRPSAASVWQQSQTRASRPSPAPRRPSASSVVWTSDISAAFAVPPWTLRRSSARRARRGPSSPRAPGRHATRTRARSGVPSRCGTTGVLQDLPPSRDRARARRRRRLPGPLLREPMREERAVRQHRQRTGSPPSSRTSRLPAATVSGADHAPAFGASSRIAAVAVVSRGFDPAQQRRARRAPRPGWARRSQGPRGGPAGARSGPCPEHAGYRPGRPGRRAGAVWFGGGSPPVHTTATLTQWIGGSESNRQLPLLAAVAADPELAGRGAEVERGRLQVVDVHARRAGR